MADTAVAITAGTGTSIDTRTEGTNGNHRQVIVIGDPTTNAGVAPVDATAGLKVDLGADNDITGTVTANLGATDNAVLDDIAAKLATIDADTSILAAGVSTEYQVDIVGALPAGANAIGKLAANSGVDIGDVDVTSSALPTGASTAAKQPALGTAGTASTDVISVQGIASMTPLVVDLGVNNDVTVTSGTIDLGATDNAVLDAIAASLTALDNSVDGNYLNANMNIAGTDVATGSGNATGTLRVELPTNGTGVIATVGAVTAITNALPAGTNGIGKLTANSGVDIGDVDVTSTPTPDAKTSGGATPYKLVSAATTNATSLKASAGQVYMITASSVNAAVRYLKFYNKASAPTVGSDTPVFTFAIPGNTAGAGTNIPVPDCGLEFTTGIAFALTTEATDAGTTAVAVNEIVINIAYQ